MKTDGGQDSDCQFAGYYVHPRSGLNLTVHRAYSTVRGLFLNRDPIQESGGQNLFNYCENDPINTTDGTGLIPTTPPNCGTCPPPNSNQIAQCQYCDNKCRAKEGLTGVQYKNCFDLCMWAWNNLRERYKPRPRPRVDTSPPPVIPRPDPGTALPEPPEDSKWKPSQTPQGPPSPPPPPSGQQPTSPSPPPPVDLTPTREPIHLRIEYNEPR